MEAFAGYESDVESTQAVDADDIQVSEVDITGSQEYGEALPGTQEYDDVELAESVFHIVRLFGSSTSGRRVPGCHRATQSFWALCQSSSTG